MFPIGLGGRSVHETVEEGFNSLVGFSIKQFKGVMA